MIWESLNSILIWLRNKGEQVVGGDQRGTWCKGAPRSDHQDHKVRNPRRKGRIGIDQCVVGHSMQRLWAVGSLGQVGQDTRPILRGWSPPQQPYPAQIYSPASNTDSPSCCNVALSFSPVASLVEITRSRCILLHALCNEHLAVGGKNERRRVEKKTLLATHGGNYGILLRQECSHDGRASDGGPCGLLTGLYGQFNEHRHQMSLVSEGLKWESAPLFDGGSQMLWLSFGVGLAEGGRPRQCLATQICRLNYASLRE